MRDPERKGIVRTWLLEHDWITEIKPVGVCEGRIWKRIALKHLYSMGGRPAEGIPDKAKCKFKARYHYEGVIPGKKPTGNYCAHHAAATLWATHDEMDRTMKWSEERGYVIRMVGTDD